MTEPVGPDGARGPRPLRDTLSGLRLRELLTEVQDRIDQIVEGRDRLDGLVEAMLAVTAGIAVDSARLYEQARARQAWIAATRDIATGMLSGASPATVFRRVVEQALTLTGADGTLVAVPTDTTSSSGVDDRVVVEAAGAFTGDGRTVVLDDPAIGLAFRERTPCRCSRAAQSTAVCSPVSDSTRRSDTPHRGERQVEFGRWSLANGPSTAIVTASRSPTSPLSRRP